MVWGGGWWPADKKGDVFRRSREVDAHWRKGICTLVDAQCTVEKRRMHSGEKQRGGCRQKFLL